MSSTYDVAVTRLSLSLSLLFTIARVNAWVRRWAGRPVGSRLEW